MFVKPATAGLLASFLSHTLASPLLFRREEKICPVIDDPASGCVPLIIGQKDSGASICYKLENDGKTLVVTYGKIEGYPYTELQLFVGPTSGSIPGTAPGQFPYGTGDKGGCVINGDGTGTCTVPLGDAVPCGQSFYIASHAATSLSETVWGKGTCMKVNKNTGVCNPWAMYSTFHISCPPCPPDPEPPTETQCELGTGFGYSAGYSTPLKNLAVDPKIKRWGWYETIPASTLKSGGISGQIWVGAAHNNIPTTGTNVGSFTVSTNPTTLVTTACAKLNAGYDLGAVHIDIGCDVPGKEAKSPGQYTYTAKGFDFSGAADREHCHDFEASKEKLESCLADGGNVYFILHVDVNKGITSGTCPAKVPDEDD